MIIMATTVMVKCDNCGDVFEKPLKFYNLSKKLNAKQFCTRDCYLQYHRVNVVCDNCGKSFTRQRNLNNNGHNFCGHSCANSFNNALKIGTNSRNYVNGKSSYRKLAFSMFEHKCAICGYDDKRILEVHHIDGNRTHNNISNLIILCPNCHKYLTKNIYTIDELKTLNN